MTSDEHEIDALRLVRQMLAGDPADGAWFSFSTNEVDDVVGIAVTLGTMYAGLVIALQRDRGDADPQASALEFVEGCLAERILAGVVEAP